MALGDIVKVTIYLTRREDIPRLRDIRAERLAVAPTVTMVLVAGLHAPDWLVEIEAVAAAA
jgi:enamine deaminase RidA (YjgF/YER057c/UK114 family)